MSAVGAYRGPGRPPVVLLHGTNDSSATLQPLAEVLRAAGREPVLLDYGRHPSSLRGRSGSGGLAPLAESQREVAAAVAEVAADAAAATSARGGPPGTPYVDVIGHSQGGLHALGCAAAMPDRVGHAILLGTPLYGVMPLGRTSRLAHIGLLRRAFDAILGPSALDMVAGSRRLPALAELPPGPRYLLVASRHDRLVRPGPLARAGIDDRLRVVWLQDLDPGRKITHVGLLTDPLVAQVVVQELATPSSVSGPPRP